MTDSETGAAQRFAEALWRSRVAEPDRWPLSLESEDRQRDYADEAEAFLRADPELEAALDLGLAWAETERALPDGWTISFMSAFDGSAFLASAMSHRSSLRLTEGLGDDEGAVVVEGEGSSPTVALTNLARKLEERNA